MMVRFCYMAIVMAAVSPGAAEPLAPASSSSNPEGEVPEFTELTKIIANLDEDIRVWRADVKAVTKVRNMERAEYERLPQPVSLEAKQKEMDSFRQYAVLVEHLWESIALASRNREEKLAAKAEAQATDIANSLFAMRIAKSDEDIRVWNADLKAVTKVREIERAQYEQLPQPVSPESKHTEMESFQKYAVLVENLWQNIAQANQEREQMLADKDEVKDSEVAFALETLGDATIPECHRNTGCFSLQLEGAGRFITADMPEINWGVSWKFSESHRALFANLLDSNGVLTVNVTSGTSDNFCVLALGGDPGSQTPEFLMLLQQQGLRCEFVTMQGPQGVHAYKLRTTVSTTDDCGPQMHIDSQSESELLDDCDKMPTPMMRKAKDAGEYVIMV